jgi:hypothetical protein
MVDISDGEEAVTFADAPFHGRWQASFQYHARLKQQERRRFDFLVEFKNA